MMIHGQVKMNSDT